VKRHVSLHDLSRDHLLALVHARALRRAAAGEPDAGTVEEAARAFVVPWHEDVLHHFREEEEVLLPILARHEPPTASEDVRRLLDDHAWLREAAADLEERLGRGAAGDVRDLAARIGERLDAHARLEERQVFPRLEALFTPLDLEDLARRSLAFRERWRGPGSIGPDRGHEPR